MRPRRIPRQLGPLPPTRGVPREGEAGELGSPRPRTVEVRHSRRGVYIISVAARLLAMHPQTLRKYERLGLVRPSRTEGMLRLYSEEDLARLRMIRFLVEEQRMNLAGVEMALRMVNQLRDVQRLLASLQVDRKETSEPIQQHLQSMLEMLHFSSVSEASLPSSRSAESRDRDA